MLSSPVEIQCKGQPDKHQKQTTQCYPSKDKQVYLHHAHLIYTFINRRGKVFYLHARIKNLANLSNN